MPSFLSDPAVRKRSAVLVASLLFILVGTGSIYFIVVALKQISTEFGWPRTVPSIAYALSYFGAGIGGVFMGWWLDRRGMAMPAFLGGSMIGLGGILTSQNGSQGPGPHPHRHLPRRRVPRLRRRRYRRRTWTWMCPTAIRETRSR